MFNPSTPSNQPLDFSLMFTLLVSLFLFLFCAVHKGFLSFIFSLSPFLTPLYSIVQTKGRDNVATHSQPCCFVFNLLFSLLNNTFFLASFLPTVAMISSFRQFGFLFWSVITPEYILNCAKLRSMYSNC